MMYELATLTVTVGSTARATAAIGTDCAAGGGRLLGCFVADIGALNRIYVLRSFDDDAAQAAERERVLRSASPFGCAEFLTALTIDRYLPFPNLPPIEPGAFGAIYEIRSYVLKIGGLTPTLAGWAEALPARMAFSKMIVAMYTLDGAPRITHIWPYADLNQRAALRAEAVRRGIWPPKSTGWLTPEMQSSICLPADISPLH